VGTTVPLHPLMRITVTSPRHLGHLSTKAPKSVGPNDAPRPIVTTSVTGMSDDSDSAGGTSLEYRGHFFARGAITRASSPGPVSEVFWDHSLHR
jgi:hypothetical protein